MSGEIRLAVLHGLPPGQRPAGRRGLPVPGGLARGDVRGYAAGAASALYEPPVRWMRRATAGRRVTRRRSRTPPREICSTTAAALLGQEAERHAGGQPVHPCRRHPGSRGLGSVRPAQLWVPPSVAAGPARLGCRRAWRRQPGTEAARCRNRACERVRAAADGEARLTGTLSPMPSPRDPEHRAPRAQSTRRCRVGPRAGSQRRPCCCRHRTRCGSALGSSWSD